MLDLFELCHQRLRLGVQFRLFLRRFKIRSMLWAVEQHRTPTFSTIFEPCCALLSIYFSIARRANVHNITFILYVLQYYSNFCTPFRKTHALHYCESVFCVLLYTWSQSLRVNGLVFKELLSKTKTWNHIIGMLLILYYTVDSYYDSIMYINELTDIYILLSRIHVQLRDFVAKLTEIRQFLKRISSARVR